MVTPTSFRAAAVLFSSLLPLLPLVRLLPLLPLSALLPLLLMLRLM
jgi:hypothetical protein